jgi:hypothetical protein
VRAAASVVAVFTILNGAAVHAEAPGVRNAHALAYDAGRGRMLLFGGADEGGVRGDLWEWDGAAWRLVAAKGPPPRTFAALAYDPGRERLVLYGGNRVLFGTGADKATFLDDMWEWRRGGWREVEVATPPARAEASVAYDSSRRRLVLFGGYRTAADGRVRLGDTWEWDGRRWEQKNPPVAPSPRNGAAMAYDPHRRRVVLFGGSGRSADTWEWDGTAWASVDAPAPGRFNSVMTYDGASRSILRFGGWNGESREGDTWRYDGRRWERLDVPGPEPRNHATMAYDERRRVVVLYGGHDGDRVFGDTWEWRAGSWSRVSAEPPRVRLDNGH